MVTVDNAVKIRSRANATEVKEKVQAAFRRQAKADAKHIEVKTEGDEVTLSGNASSWHAVEDAASAA